MYNYLVEEYLEKYETFIITSGDYLYRCFNDIITLIPQISTEEFYLLVVRINTFFKYDIDYLLNTNLLELVYSEFDLEDILQYHRTSDNTKLLILNVINNILYTLILTIKENNLYLSEFPNVDNPYGIKSRICYRISTFDINNGTITLIKQNPWEF